jgi:hypothetical protein
MSKQILLFDDAKADSTFESNIGKHKYRFREVDVGDITFQAGQSEPVHKWYRLTPSFSPGLVRFFFEEFEISARDLVLDPFSGRGTTGIECQKHGIPCVAYEINPSLQRVGALSLLWRPTRSDLFEKYLEDLRTEVRGARSLELDELLAKFETTVPIIHDLYRWWKPQVLKDLIIARELARSTKFKQIGHFLWVAVASSVLDCANIHRNHPTITFDDDHQRQIVVEDVLSAKVADIQGDLDSMRDEVAAHSGLAKVELHDSCESLKPGLVGKECTHVITSPPYPNRFSYVHQTRPELHFMELIRERREATEIDLRSVGGTWGRATSVLARSYISPPPELVPILDYIKELKPKSVLMCNYATKYFFDLHKHIKLLRSVVAPGFRGAYVVGNSRLSGVEIFTEAILARIFELDGFVVDEIILFRKRGGRQRLYETAVCIKA